MNFFRNSEVRKGTLVFLALTALVPLVGLFFGTETAVLLLLAGIMFTALFLLITHRRYKKIRALSLDIDRLLHSAENVNFSDYSEGELAILQDEIEKMTDMLKTQQETLISDKRYLADSIADISHQIRTPLTSINLLVSFLLDPEISADRRSSLLHELMELLKRIDWLISSLLKISKLDAGTIVFRRDPVKISSLVSKACEPLLVPIELREQTLLTEIGANDCFTGDIQWTAEALTNIVKNCMEHTPNGGTLRITSEETAVFSQITVSDNGSGISADDLPHIFERFYKGKNSDEKSVGIGLALARTIIASQSGTLKAANLPSGGAEFTVRFYKSIV